jgi:uncharacterized membrane protein YoaK (UPF0700 family)
MTEERIKVRRWLVALMAWAVTFAVGVTLSVASGLEPKVWVPAAFVVPAIVAVVVLTSRPKAKPEQQ